MYQLIPSEELRRARAEFPHYEICVLHDDAGIPEVTAVLKPPYQGIGLAVLVCAASVSELVHTLRTAPKAKLPRRDPNRRYWPRPWELRPVRSEPHTSHATQQQNSSSPDERGRECG